MHSFSKKQEFVALFSLLQREILRFWRVMIQAVLSPLINATLYLLIFGVYVGTEWSPVQGVSYLFFLIPGVAMLALLNNSFQNSSSSIVISKFHGDLEDLKIVPLSPWQIVWAMSLAATLRGLLVAALVCGVGMAFLLLGHQPLFALPHPLLLLLFFLLAGLFFAKIGICIGFFCESYEKLNAVSSFVLQPLIYLGGIFFPLQHLTPFWQKVSYVNPILYYINAVRYAMLGFCDLPIATCIQMMLLSLCVVHPLALYSVKKGRYSRW